MPQIPAGSKLAVGSSKISSGGISGVRTEATATFCFSPPDSVCSGRLRRDSMPTSARTASL